MSADRLADIREVVERAASLFARLVAESLPCRVVSTGRRTIRLVALQRPTAGVAEVFGQAAGAHAVHARRMIGFLPTNPSFPAHLRPIEYLDLLGKLCRLPRQVRQPRLTSLLRAVGL